MRRSALLLLAPLACLAAMGAGCRGGPSPEYQEAQFRFDGLLRELGDDAYADPRMSEVEALLAKVKPRSQDAPAAAALLQQISAERARAEQERAQAEAPQEAAAPPADPWARSEQPPPPEPDAGAPDAGAPYPVRGMPVAEVRARFSSCFLPRDPVLVGDLKYEAFELRDLPSCRDGFPQFQGQLLMARDGKVEGTLDQSTVQKVVVRPDGGR